MGWPGPMTHRQYLTWCEWRLMDKNEPDRGDHYTMQLTAEVHRLNYMFSETPPRIRLQDFHLPFVRTVLKPEPKLTPEEKKAQEEANRNAAEEMFIASMIAKGARLKQVAGTPRPEK